MPQGCLTSTDTADNIVLTYDRFAGGLCLRRTAPQAPLRQDLQPSPGKGEGGPARHYRPPGAAVAVSGPHGRRGSLPPRTAQQRPQGRPEPAALLTTCGAAASPSSRRAAGRRVPTEGSEGSARASRCPPPPASAHLARPPCSRTWRAGEGATETAVKEKTSEGAAPRLPQTHLSRLSEPLQQPPSCPRPPQVSRGAVPAGSGSSVRSRAAGSLRPALPTHSQRRAARAEDGAPLAWRGGPGARAGPGRAEGGWEGERRCGRTQLPAAFAPPPGGRRPPAAGPWRWRAAPGPPRCRAPSAAPGTRGGCPDKPILDGEALSEGGAAARPAEPRRCCGGALRGGEGGERGCPLRSGGACRGEGRFVLETMRSQCWAPELRWQQVFGPAGCLCGGSGLGSGAGRGGAGSGCRGLKGGAGLGGLRWASPCLYSRIRQRFWLVLLRN